MLGMTPSDCLVMGDGENDLEMLRNVASAGGVAVAVGNAVPSLKAVASHVSLKVLSPPLCQPVSFLFPPSLSSSLPACLRALGVGVHVPFCLSCEPAHTHTYSHSLTHTRRSHTCNVEFFRRIILNLCSCVCVNFCVCLRVLVQDHDRGAAAEAIRRFALGQDVAEGQDSLPQTSAPEEQRSRLP